MPIIALRRSLSTAAKTPRSIAVTTVLFKDQEGLLNWAASFAADHIRDVAEKRAGAPLFASDWESQRTVAIAKYKLVTEERKGVGKRVHEAIDKLMRLPSNETFDLDAYKSNQEVYECAKAVDEWFKRGSYERLNAEFTVKSDKHRYHGKVDCLVRDGKTGQTCILDFKVKPKELDFVTAMQLAAYVSAYNEMMGYEENSSGYCSSAIAVQIKYDGRRAQVVEKRVRDIKAAETAFHCHHLVYRLENLNEAKQGWSDNWIFST